ncbi:MAG: hypothetical protein MI747_04690 [Desulfobacterales bacterium]|nr:hypothetical protein [Desulfobacterales bacterium]
MHTHSPLHFGRFRLRNPLLKTGEIGDTLVEQLRATQGVLEVKLNRCVGSILVIYDRVKTRAASILDRVSQETGINCGKWVKKGSRILGTKTARRNVKLGMALGIAGTLGGLAVSGKMHTIAGGAFIGFLALHAYQHRRTLLR